MQWYFLYIRKNLVALMNRMVRKKRLLKIFEGWCDNVVDLLHATDEEDIIRRDIYDRFPILTWGKGRVTLLGDSVHAMQLNMGQGGCMAIEVGYQLAVGLEKAWRQCQIIWSSYRHPFLFEVFLTKFRIPHPGRVFIKIAMPFMLDWVLGGNSSNLQRSPLSCRLSDQSEQSVRICLPGVSNLRLIFKRWWMVLLPT